MQGPERGAERDFSVVIPAKDAAHMLPQVLDAVTASRPAPKEVILYDDGSSDDTGALAEARGVRVIRNNGQSFGPGVGRNRAVETVTTPYVVFVDADVVVEPDACGRLVDAMAEGDNVAAAFGAYGVFQAGSNIAAKYVNLRHHYFHVHGDQSAETFWSGLGAVNVEIFGKLGGFDSAFDRPSIEDIELGTRLRQLGYDIRLVHLARGTHLKNWTVGQTWHTDFFCRALPWSTMIAEGRAPKILNVSRKEQVKAILACLIVLSLLAAVVNPAVLVLTGLLSLGYLYANLRFYRTLLRHGGLPTMAASNGLHFAYYLYSTLAFAIATLGHQWRMLKARLASLLRPGRDRTSPATHQAE
ncbi:glycosyltransferase family 2 protein [Parvularcula lutaonensis]|uniref:Glycosyltransferase family 2 protein n=1 Tax=Parvularcula lutaonensis TaxID=491923 RepID=A0ABV7M8E4_9PROT|nr:glycosyltransferase family 2 protein [Parvularcula lutaonensis]GGY44555.1 hypothetical protein GCM10007148_11830 [Parvularcula lutaonensis]